MANNLFHDFADLIINLSPTDFDAATKTLKVYLEDIAFVNFHSSSCSHCISHAPTWVHFAKINRISGAIVAAIDCDEFRDICSTFNVSTTPTIKVFKKGTVTKENLGESIKDLSDCAQNEFKLVLIETKFEENISSKTRTNNGDESSISKEDSMEESTALRNQNAYSKNLKNRREKTVNPKVKILSDAALAIRYGFEKGVFLGRFELSSAELQALISWLDLLRRAFPSKARKWQLDWFYKQIQDLTSTGSPLTSVQFDKLLLGWDFGKKFHESWNWNYCGPSSSKAEAGSGYTCGLWLLFHILSVSVAQTPLPKEIDASSAIHGFITHFFSCNECRENFLKHNPKPYKSEISGDEYAFALWLWREHNYVSHRLNREDREDGRKFQVRAMFPTIEMCSTCHRSGSSSSDDLVDFDEGVIVRYLDYAYSGFPVEDELVFADIDEQTQKNENKEISVISILFFIMLSIFGTIGISRKLKHVRARDKKRKAAKF